jgi:hypothetical protein
MAEKSPSASRTTTDTLLSVIPAQAGILAKTPVVTGVTAATEDEKLSPTRYGDWEKNGRCIDF